MHSLYPCFFTRQALPISTSRDGGKRSKSSVARPVYISGEGARRVGGRWNPVGCPVHYASTSAALTVIEVLVHVDPDDLPPMVLVTCRIPDEKVTVYSGTLPENWRSYPAPAELPEIGRQWLESKTSLALQVPSVIFPEGPEANVLINPLHPEISDLIILKQDQFTFDTRLFRK